MQKRAKNEVFGHFLEFGLLDRFDIAYCEMIQVVFGHFFFSFSFSSVEGPQGSLLVIQEDRHISNEIY